MRTLGCSCKIAQRHLADVPQLVPGLADPVLASGMDPGLHLREACLHVLACRKQMKDDIGSCVQVLIN